MPRVTHVAKARKAIPSAGVAVGDEYYWWKFAFGPKMVSKTPPRRQQLTQSSYLQQLYDLEDQRDAMPADDSLPDAIAELAGALRELASECESSLENIPDSLKEAPAGELLTERIDQLNSAADELDGIDTEMEAPDEDADEDERDEHVNNHWQRVQEEAQAVSFDG